MPVTKDDTGKQLLEPLHQGQTVTAGGETYVNAVMTRARSMQLQQQRAADLDLPDGEHNPLITPSDRGEVGEIGGTCKGPLDIPPSASEDVHTLCL